MEFEFQLDVIEKIEEEEHPGRFAGFQLSGEEADFARSDVAVGEPGRGDEILFVKVASGNRTGEKARCQWRAGWGCGYGIG